MKKFITLFISVLTLSLSAQDYKGFYGFGAAIGEPSGFSIKKFNNHSEAVQYTLGYSFLESNKGINFGADYLIHKYDYIIAEKGTIPVYYGLGAHLKSWQETTQIYARVPLGLAYEFSDYPMDVFIEAAPGLTVFPSISLVTDYTVGARIYFDLRKTLKEL